MPKVKAYCQNCSHFKKFDNVDSQTREREHFRNICAEWKEVDTPVAPSRQIQNQECHLQLNAKNHCLFWTTERISSAKLKRLRTVYKLQQAK